MTSVFEMPPDELKFFIDQVLPLKTFDEHWNLMIEVTRNNNVNHPDIEAVIASIYSEATRSVAQDLWQIYVWCEELRSAKNANT